MPGLNPNPNPKPNPSPSPSPSPDLPPVHQAPSATFREAGLEQLRVPTPDYAAPSQRDIRRAVAFIDQHVQAGHHASHGRERCICACACACACAYCICKYLPAN